MTLFGGKNSIAMKSSLRTNLQTAYCLEKRQPTSLEQIVMPAERTSLQLAITPSHLDPLPVVTSFFMAFPIWLWATIVLLHLLTVSPQALLLSSMNSLFSLRVVISAGKLQLRVC